MTVTTWVETDGKALQDNLHSLRALLAPGAGLQAVVKADAYGHGALLAARWFLEAGAISLAVATGDESLELREGGIQAPILLLTGLMGQEEEIGLVREGIELTVCSPEQVQWADCLGRAAGRPALVHLKVDTGLGRLGVPWDRAEALVPWLRQASSVRLVGIFTHLACADEATSQGREYTQVQGHRFQKALVQLTAQGIHPPLRHAANSAALFHYPELHYDLVRAGCALYGFFPTSRELESPMASLQPGLHWRARVLETGRFPGSGFPWARVAAGHMHGFPPRGQAVLLGGRRCRVQEVEPWSTLVEVPSQHHVSAGMEATLLGIDGAALLPAEEVAGWAGTIHEELGCSLARLPHRYLDPGPDPGVDRDKRGGVE